MNKTRQHILYNTPYVEVTIAVVPVFSSNVYRKVKRNRNRNRNKSSNFITKHISTDYDSYTNRYPVPFERMMVASDNWLAN